MSDCYRFSCRSVQQCFWESIAKLVDGFWILTTLVAAFRNCRSVRSNFTAQAHLCLPLSDDLVNREEAKETGKIPHMSWKTKMWWPKKCKISFHRVCEWVTKSEPLTILSPLVRKLVIPVRTAASCSIKILFQDFIQMSYEGLAFT